MAGGTTITNPGTFDPYKPTPEGQTFRGDHAYVFYQVPANARKYPLVMWHGIGQFSKRGKQHRMDGKGIKIFFFAGVSVFTSLISREEGMLVVVRLQAL